MSTGGTGGDVSRLFDRSASVSSPEKKLAADTAAQKGHSQHDNKVDSVLNTLKDALTPGDLRARENRGSSGSSSGRTTQSLGEQANSIMDSMKPSDVGASNSSEQSAPHVQDQRSIFERGLRHGDPIHLWDALGPDHPHRDASSSSSANTGGGGPGFLESVMPGQKEHDNKEKTSGSVIESVKSASSPSTSFSSSKFNEQPSVSGFVKKLTPSSSSSHNNEGRGVDEIQHTKQSGLNEGCTAENHYTYDKLPGTMSSGDDNVTGGEGEATPRVSAFDSRGSIGRQFTVRNFPSLIPYPTFIQSLAHKWHRDK